MFFVPATWLNGAMSTHWADEYLKRIGTPRPARASLGALRELQLAHLHTVPFENLSIHLGEPVILDQAALIRKIVQRRRGGFCYELNAAFAALLTELGFQVSTLSARVFNAEGQPGPPFDHLTLRVDLAAPWLVDVGYGRFATRPVRLDTRDDQPGPDGTFQVTPSPSGHGELDITHDGAPAYRIDPRPYQLADFAPTCWWQCTCPETTFRRSLTCSISTPSGRVTLSGNRLITTENGQRTERTLPGDPEILTAYRTHFGIDLDQVPAVAP
jgi:N-hydroxyarylamine O-acetyltransferase